MNYPPVLDEGETLARLHAGASIARFGDGELRICLGGSSISQVGSAGLKNDLRAVLRSPGSCLVGIPRLDWRSPKIENWKRYGAPAYVALYNPKVNYVSAFITRPDSAPWIDTPEYWSSVTDLWRGRDVVLVKGTERSLRRDMMAEAGNVQEIDAPARDAYHAVHGLVEALRSEKRRVLICLGAAGTVLAWRLANLGVHAMDLGHVGMTMRKAGQYQGTVRAVTFGHLALDR